MTIDDKQSDRNESGAESTCMIRHEWGGSDSPSTAVIEAVAAATNHDPTDMPPLYDHIDPDALDLLMTPRADDRANAITVSFIYEDVAVRIDRRGWVEVQLDGFDHD